MQKLTMSGVGLMAWAIAACGSRVSIGEVADATSDGATTGGAAGTSGGSAGTGGTSAAGDASDVGSGGDGPFDGGGDDVAPDTRSNCAALLEMVDPQSWIAFDSDRDNFNRHLYMMHPDRSGLMQL